MTEPTDPARARFAAIQIVRFAGLAIAMFGIVVIARRLVEPAEIVGGVLIAVGAFDLLVFPLILARRWRSK